MTKPHDREFLHRLLDLSDAVSRIRRDEAIAADPQSLERLRHQREQLSKDMDVLLRELKSEGPFHLLLKRYRFGKQHVLLLLELLKRRLRGEDPFLKGRELLSTLFASSFDMLEGLRLLAPGSRLISSQVVQADFGKSDEEADLLELRYRLNDRAFRILLRALKPGDVRLARVSDLESKPYRNNLSYVMDLRRLALLYQKRAARIFQLQEWDEFESGLSESVVLLNREIVRYSSLVRSRLESTESAKDFPLVRIASRFALTEEHLMILVTLVFRELTHGNPYLDAVDLLKLVCRSEEDLVNRRRILAEDSPLVRHGLVHIEEVIHDKSLSGEVYVPNAVVEKLLGGRPSAKKKTIDSESQAEFQKFLQDLSDSDDFFKRL